MQGRAMPRESRALRWLLLLVLGLSVCVYVFPGYVPLTAMVLPMLFGSLFLGPRELPWFIVLILISVVVLLTRVPEITVLTGGRLLVLFCAGFIILLTSFRRSRLGVGGSQGESMLVDLRDRIQGQGGIPVLPKGWHAQSALRSAGGTPFAGDFVVTARPHGGDRFEVAMVDVSGKGAGAGTRALLLSGALGGLLAALPPKEFLTSANDYLLQQNWDEGFATAIHMSLDLHTGDFEIRSAGHPPAAQRAAGSGKWTVHASEGPALGLVADAEFPSVRGTVRSGDAILLYTDGLVESRSRDIGLGIDRMLGQAEMLLRGSFDDGARRLIDQLGSRIDDRALLLIHRG
jgi:Stage II sporulation protein E (SpoIIE)